MICLGAFLTIAFTSGVVCAQVIGDPQNGLALAEQVCSGCHTVRRGQERPKNSRAPTFLEIAATPGMTDTALMVALTTPHAGMPMFTFTPAQRQDVIAYFASLR
jgi:mono/diheme cytochrome c family protein